MHYQHVSERLSAPKGILLIFNLSFALRLCRSRRLLRLRQVARAFDRVAIAIRFRADSCEFDRVIACCDTFIGAELTGFAASKGYARGLTDDGQAHAITLVVTGPDRHR